MSMIGVRYLSLTRRQTLLGAGAALLLPAATVRPKPLVFAHRGASALRPEHTLAAYAKAIADGADFIEPDLVVTRDGVLVARHENEISGTTDVAAHPRFAARRTTKTIDGEAVTGWFVEDFTLAELKTLRAIERLGSLRPESASYDGHFPIATLDEVIALVARAAARHGRPIGIAPETKHSHYFAGIGLPLEDRLLATLAAHAYTRRAPVEIQSFEVANLRYLRRKLGGSTSIKLLQLIGDAGSRPADGTPQSYAAMIEPAGLRAVADYADVVAPQVRVVIPLSADNRLGEPTGFVADAHAAGLLVRLWTFRPENRFLAADMRGDGGPDTRNAAGSIEEIRRYLATGIDGFFTDDPAIGRAAVDGDTRRLAQLSRDRADRLASARSSTAPPTA